MRLRLVTCLISVYLGASFVQADEPNAKPNSPSETKQELVKATFLITGLHCPPCTRTVENSLRNIKGVKSVKVDWNSKNAHVEFDEQVIPSQRLSKSIAETPHMMGRDMRYAGWLALKVVEVNERDDGFWERLKDALGKIPGVKQVSIFKPQSGVGVRFEEKGELTSNRLIAALAESGFKLSNY